MKSLDSFFSEKINVSEALFVNGGLADANPKYTYNECHEDTYSGGDCDTYTQLTDDDGVSFSSGTTIVDCPPT